MLRPFSRPRSSMPTSLVMVSPSFSSNSFSQKLMPSTTRILTTPVKKREPCRQSELTNVIKLHAYRIKYVCEHATRHAATVESDWRENRTCTKVKAKFYHYAIFATIFSILFFFRPIRLLFSTKEPQPVLVFEGEKIFPWRANFW